MGKNAPTICVLGDVHGHLQLALCMAARWQRELGEAFEAVLLCGDVGVFTEESQLDSATRSHARRNPCELEFLYHWAADPQPRWLEELVFLQPLPVLPSAAECRATGLFAVEGSSIRPSTSP